MGGRFGPIGGPIWRRSAPDGAHGGPKRGRRGAEGPFGRRWGPTRGRWRPKGGQWGGRGEPIHGPVAGRRDPTHVQSPKKPSPERSHKKPSPQPSPKPSPKPRTQSSPSPAPRRAPKAAPAHWVARGGPSKGQEGADEEPMLGRSRPMRGRWRGRWPADGVPPWGGGGADLAPMGARRAPMGTDGGPMADPWGAGQPPKRRRRGAVGRP